MYDFLTAQNTTNVPMAKTIEGIVKIFLAALQALPPSIEMY